MNGLKRYRIDLGPRCAFDNHTYMDINYSNENPWDVLNELCWEHTEEDEWNFISPEKSNVTPNQKLNIYGISLTVPTDAAKMVKWSSNSIKSALVFFLKSDDTLVNNAFAYLICMDNWVGLTIDEETYT